MSGWGLIHLAGALEPVSWSHSLQSSNAQPGVGTIAPLYFPHLILKTCIITSPCNPIFHPAPQAVTRALPAPVIVCSFSPCMPFSLSVSYALKVLLPSLPLEIPQGPVQRPRFYGIFLTPTQK